MQGTSKNYYAVPVGTDYVEVRIGTTPPVGIRSIIRRGNTIWRAQLFYRGGRVLGVCSKSKFRARTGLTVSKLTLISKEQRFAALKGEI